MSQPWDLDAAGNIIVAPVVGYAMAVFYESAIGLRLEFARSSDQLQQGKIEAEQVLLSPQIALEIGRALVKKAEFVLGPHSGSSN